MKLRLLSIGREKADATVPLVEEYLQRIRKHLPIETEMLRPGAESRMVERLDRDKASGYRVVALDERGPLYTSVQFADRLQAHMVGGIAGITFAIGGADGFPQGALDRADERLALSPMTLPHRVARLILAEQIYRALCILKNTPYHK